MVYAKHIQKNQTPQNQPIPGTVPNSAGGYSFPVDDWKRLDRFLILGSEGGTYYIKERKLTLENAEAVGHCIQADGPRVVARIVEISDSGRAPKNEPAIFALAMCIAYGDDKTRHAAAEALSSVCRTGTHLFHFAEYANTMRGWGRGLRRAVAHWYLQAESKDLAYQAVKYQQRDGWTHRDLLRLTHAHTTEEARQSIFQWIVKGWETTPAEPPAEEATRIIWAFERAKTATRREILRLITDYKLPREAIPNQWLTDPDVWRALLPSMGLTALLRNLGNMSKVGALADREHRMVHDVVEKLTDAAALKRARIHPVAVLTALLTYQRGRGVRGSGEWQPVTRVVDALDAAFYKAFGNVTPTGKRTVLALDVSGSMGSGSIGGVPGLTPRVGSAAMALITAATEREYQIVGFSHELVHVPISPRQRLDDAVRQVSIIPMGGTDCSLPMTWATKNRMEVDAFVVYTDSETWAGPTHPVQALREYREKFGIPAKLIVVGMVSNGFTIADPQDGGMMDVVGFDSAAPELMSDFIRG